MPDDPLDTAPVVTPVPSRDPREFVCGACGCRLARNGEILATGDTYKKFLKHDQILEAKDREISALASEVATLKAEIATLKSSGPAATSHQHRPGGRVS